MKNLIFILREIIYNGYELFLENKEEEYSVIIAGILSRGLYGIKLLIDDDFTRPPIIESFNINEVLKDYEKNNRVVINCVDTVVKTDKKYLHHILANVISNGLRYSEDEVVVKVVSLENELQISIIDKGCGFDDTENIFNKLHNKSNVKGSSGVGLYLVGKLLKALNATATVESKKGVGTNFLICIPTTYGL